MLLSLTAAELALRLFVARWDFSAVFRFDETKTPCYALEPGSSAVYEGWFTKVPPTHLAINSRGYRDREYTQRPPPGTLRIALLGDSHVFGLGTEVEDGLPRRLEADLRGRLQRPVEVVNAGVPGYDLPKEVARAAQVLDDYSPDVLVFVAGALDLEDRPCSFWKAEVWPLLRVSRLAVTVFVNLVVRRQGLQAMPDEERVALVLRQVARLQALAASRPASGGLGPRLVLAQTSMLLPASTLDNDRLVRAIQDAGVTVLPMIAPWNEVFQHQERFVVRGEGHPNAAGMAVLAPALGAELASSGLLDPR